MSPIFWLDVAALSVSAVVAFSLTLIALGAGPSNPLNRSFALCAFMVALWAVFSALIRLTLWLEKDGALRLAELATLMFTLMQPMLLIFTARYVNRQTRRTYRIAILGLAVIALLAVPLFKNLLVSNPRLESNGSTTLELSAWGMTAAAVPALYTFWSLALFWQERRNLEEPYLALSVTILAVGFILGGLLQVSFPVLSFTNTLSVALLGYGVISRQVFNPLKERTRELQRQVAERIRVEEALRESEEKLRNFVEQSHDGIVLIDQQGNVSEWNASQEQITGLKRSEVLGKPLWDIQFQLIPDNLKKTSLYELQKKLIHDFLQTKQAPWLRQLMEREIQRPDGSLRTIQSLVFPIETERGFSAGAIWRDMTETIQAAKALRENEQRLELAVKSADYALWDWEIKTGRVIRNARWADMLGYTLQEIDAHIDFWRRLRHPDDLLSIDQALTAHIEGRAPLFEAEYRLRTKSGDWIWVHDRGQVVERDADGHPLRLIGLHRDVTESKKIADALKRSEQEKRAVLDSMSEMVAYQDLDMNILWANKAASDSIGLTPGQLIGHHCYELWHQRHIPCEVCPVIVTRQSGALQRGEVTSPDGRSWLISAYPVRNDSGEIEGVVEVTQNITERRQGEQRRMALALETERANVLRRFISDASHDLRTPLTSFKLSLHLLQEDDPNLRQRHLSILEKQTAHLEKLLEDMLNMSRLDAITAFKFEPLDLNNLVQNLLSRQDALAKRKNHRLNFSGDPHLPLVPADKIHLDQAITQILVNALRYTPEGGTISVQTFQRNQYAGVEIRDNGIGISPEHLPRIFEHFYRIDPARSTTEGGSGLGLAIARRVVEAHQGHIDVESEPGQGSCFKVWLPIEPVSGT